MEKKRMPDTNPEILKTISIHYGFFFRTIISGDKIELTNKEADELKALIEERDYFSIKELVHKARQ